MKLRYWFAVVPFVVACSRESPPAAESLGKAEDCIPLGQTCTVRSESRAVDLTLPAGVEPLTPFSVVAAVKGSRARRVTVDFSMKGMDMGKNRFALAEQGEHWVGNAILPVCTTGRVDWVATVEVETEQRTLHAVFEFETQR